MITGSGESLVSALANRMYNDNIGDDMTQKKALILVQDVEISVIDVKDEDYISLTDMTKKFGDPGLIEHWLRNRDTIEFLGVWEQIHNQNFNTPEFGVIKKDAGANRFTMSARKWATKTNGIGLIAKTGKYGGTYAHRDIAFEFGSWLSPEFKLYLIKEFQRLKETEQKQINQEWNVRRILSKVNYHIHTSAVKNNLIPEKLPSLEKGLIYAEEADLLNVALFGLTAKEWRELHPTEKGNLRDQATIEQLIVLANLESLNAVMIDEGKSQEDRLRKLHETARSQMKTLIDGRTVERHTLN